MPNILGSVVAGDVNSTLNGLKERFVLGILSKLNVDGGGRLRVAFDTASSMATVTTVSTVSVISNWGVQTTTGKSQSDTMAAYQGSYRRNLIQS